MHARDPCKSLGLRLEVPGYFARRTSSSQTDKAASKSIVIAMTRQPAHRSSAPDCPGNLTSSQVCNFLHFSSPLIHGANFLTGTHLKEEPPKQAKTVLQPPSRKTHTHLLQRRALLHPHWPLPEPSRFPE